MTCELGFPATKRADYYFLSYNHEDSEMVSGIAKELDSMGINIWYDDGLVAGDMIDAILAERIRDAKAFILFFTKGILRKENSYVQQEYEVARDTYGKRTLVIVLDRIGDAEILPERAFWLNSLEKTSLIDGTGSKSAHQMACIIVEALHDIEKTLASCEESRGFTKSDRSSWGWSIKHHPEKQYLMQAGAAGHPSANPHLTSRKAIRYIALTAILILTGFVLLGGGWHEETMASKGIGRRLLVKDSGEEMTDEGKGSRENAGDEIDKGLYYLHDLEYTEGGSYAIVTQRNEDGLPLIKTVYDMNGQARYTLVSEYDYDSHIYYSKRIETDGRENGYHEVICDNEWNRKENRHYTAGGVVDNIVIYYYQKSDGYTTDGNNIQIRYKPGSNIPNLKLYTDDNNHRVKTEYFDAAGKKKKVIIGIYEEDDRVEETATDGCGNLLYRYRYTYDADGYRESAACYDSSDQLRYEIRYIPNLQQCSRAEVTLYDEDGMKSFIYEDLAQVKLP